MTEKSDNTSLKARKKPLQQRSRLTQDAILEAFVRLLCEKSYAQLSMRDIALVAGVGLGTLYEYFPGKRAIAAHCMHQRFKSVGQALRSWIIELQDWERDARIKECIARLLTLHAHKAQEWSALILLERQISDLPAFRSLYAEIASIWAMALPVEQKAQADMVHAAVYGVLYPTLMLEPQKIAQPEFRQQLQTLVLGYLHLAARSA